MVQNLIPPRLHAILAREANVAVVLARARSKQTACYLWDRTNDTFTLGQWVKAKVYQYRCDISPHGKYWIYLAINNSGKIYTGVAIAPYFKAIDFYEKADTWNGGGLFIENKMYWLNECGKYEQRQKSYLKVAPQYQNFPNIQSECPYIYTMRLMRDGWAGHMAGSLDEGNNFTKNIGDWQLLKVFCAAHMKHIGRGAYFERHKLINTKTHEERDCPEWEWADIDTDRIVYAEEGKLYALSPDDLDNPKELHDFNGIEFEAIKAPY